MSQAQAAGSKDMVEFLTSHMNSKSMVKSFPVDSSKPHHKTQFNKTNSLILPNNNLSCSFQTIFDELFEYDEYNIDDDEVNEM